ncbi:MAG: cohesin domain-containing protein [Candidatus Omnitrophica bacterium]|nr:cohesin domain-containing protein [Candidatus Omnitrophota bacterium]
MPKIYVQPKQNVFSTETTSVGTTFTINISTSGWEDPGLYSYEFKLRFDPTLLEATEAKYPSGHFLPAPNFEVPPELNNQAGYILFGVTKLGDVPGSTGSGILATATFKIIKAPPPTLKCDLEITDITFLDPAGNSITEYDVEHGYYEFSAPKPPVFLKVEPASVSAAEVDDEVTITVTINEMQSALQLANVTFKLNYNTTLLSTSMESITPGKTFPYFNAIVEEDYVKVEVQMATQAPFPSGKETLVTIKFKAVYVPPTMVTSPLTLSDVVLTNIDGNIVEYNRLEHGEYKVPVTVNPDLNGDGKVNIEDIYVFAQSFGSYPGHPRWDPRADMDGDRKITVIDAVLIAMNFRG